MDDARRQSVFSWMALAVIAGLCVVLAVLQYSWIGEVSRAERERLHDRLVAALSNLSREFNRAIAAEFGLLQPRRGAVERIGREQAYAAAYQHWRSATSHRQIFRRVSLLIPQPDGTVLYREADPVTGEYSPADWPSHWQPIREKIEAYLDGEARPPFAEETISILEMPQFHGGERPGHGRPAEREWLMAEFSVPFIVQEMLRPLLREHLPNADKLEYRTRIVLRDQPRVVVHRSGGEDDQWTSENVDASAMLFGSRTRRDEGRWLLMVRHGADSLDAIVERVRRRNMAVAAVLLLLLLAIAAVLIRFTRQAQRVSAMQMQFVAGVSHELRTPLTVISTAAYNLRGRIAHSPGHVERYGALIQEEAEKLTALLEQVLRFASVRAGRVIRKREPVSLAALVEEAAGSLERTLEGSGCTV